jgi:hypothetical protein
VTGDAGPGGGVGNFRGIERIWELLQEKGWPRLEILPKGGSRTLTGHVAAYF